MQVRKNRNIGIAFIICGIAILAASIATSQPLLTISGSLIVVFGIPYVIGTMFEVDVAKKTITVYALLGPAKKEYPFEAISCQGGSVFIKTDGKERKLPISKGVCEGGDWKEFIKSISGK